MATSYQPLESGAVGASDIRNPAKSVNHSPVFLLQPKTYCAEDDVTIISAAPASRSKQCTTPSVHSSSLLAGTFITTDGVDSAERSASSGSLHVHPFADPSARHICSNHSPPDHLTNTSTPYTTSTISLGNFPPRPPSSVSFILMGKGSKGSRNGVGLQTQSSDRRWGRSVSDGFPQFIQQARKSGSRLWRTLTHPSLFSSPSNSKHPNKNSASRVSARTTSLDVSFERTSALPPRPAPYFYPRHVVAVTYDSAHPSFGPARRSHGDVPNAVDNGHGGEHLHASSSSLTSEEIGSWKENRAHFIPKITEQQEPNNPNQRLLRQRLGSSLVFKPATNSSMQLRYARSEVDVSNVEARRPGDIGPGINDDPFAASLKDTFTFAHLSPPAPSTATTSAPLATATKPLSIPGKNVSKPRVSFSRSRHDSLDHGRASVEQSIPATPIGTPLSVSIPPPFSDWNDTSNSPSSVTPLLHQRSLPSSPVETPLLTPEKPTFTPRRRPKPLWDADQSPRNMRMSDTTFPNLATPELTFNRYEESALEEGASQDATFYEGVVDQSIVNLFATGYRGPRSSVHIAQPFTLDLDVDDTLDEEECLRVRKDNVGRGDHLVVEQELACLAEEWPLPPRRTLFLDSTPGRSWSRVNPKVEFFKPGSLDTASRRLRVVGHSTSYPDISATAEDQSKLLQHVKSESHLSSNQQLSFSSNASVVAVLGSTVLEHASFPSTIVLQPVSETYRSVALFIRAMNQPALVSFCAFHGETSVTASTAGGSRPLQAQVRLGKGNRATEDVTTLSIRFHRSAPESPTSLDPFAYASNTFSVHLPVTLGALATMIAKRSFAAS